MKESLKLLAALTAFCLASGLLLAYTNKVTKLPIEEAKRAGLVEALKKVMPECDNNVVADAKTVKEGNADWVFYVGTSKGALSGIAFKASSLKGYGGLIEVLVGLKPDGTIHSLQVLSADKETPGLGSKIEAPKFCDQYNGKSASDTSWAKVTKDGGQIQGITGATISSRAMTEAVRGGLEVYAKHAAEITGTANVEKKE